jgi:hypothetical protein
MWSSEFHNPWCGIWSVTYPYYYQIHVGWQLITNHFWNCNLLCQTLLLQRTHERFSESYKTRFPSLSFSFQSIITRNVHNQINANSDFCSTQWTRFTISPKSFILWYWFADTTMYVAEHRASWFSVGLSFAAADGNMKGRRSIQGLFWCGPRRVSSWLDVSWGSERGPARRLVLPINYALSAFCAGGPRFDAAATVMGASINYWLHALVMRTAYGTKAK